MYNHKDKPHMAKKTKKSIYFSIEAYKQIVIACCNEWFNIKSLLFTIPRMGTKAYLKTIPCFWRDLDHKTLTLFLGVFSQHTAFPSQLHSWPMSQHYTVHRMCALEPKRQLFSLLELDFQPVMRHHVGARTELGSSVRAASVLNSWVFSPALVFHCFLK